MATQTPRQRLASLLIGRDVLVVIDEMRADGTSWPAVRQHIADMTSGEVDVTWQAVQSWHLMAGAQSGAA